MKLNRDGRDELRSRVAKMILASVPEGSRIQLDKNMLEDLLFEKVVVDEKTGEILKLPVWSGEVLRRIDLSGISFEDVAWSLMLAYGENAASPLVKDNLYFTLYTHEGFDYCYLNEGECVDYAHTNAHIDLSKSWEAKKGALSIVNCAFADVDLTLGVVPDKSIDSIINSDVSNTGLILKQRMFADHYRFQKTDFSGDDLSGVSIDGHSLLTDSSFDTMCNFANTGVHITVTAEDLEDKDRRVNYRIMMKNGQLLGCYVNDVKIMNDEEYARLREEKLEAYKRMKESIVSMVQKSITEQSEKGFGSK